MKVVGGSRVHLDYSLASPEGEVLESCEEDGPIEIVMGGGDVPPSIEEALEGRSEGEAIEVELGPEELFGPYDPAGLVHVARSEFPDEAEVEEGMFVTVVVEADDDGETGEIEARISEVKGDEVVLDTNPPLAGRPLVFRATVRAVAEG